MLFRITFPFLFLISFIKLSAQERPLILLEDLDHHSMPTKCYCKPGVRNKTRSKGLQINYQLLSGGTIESRDDKISEPLPEFSKFRKFTSKISLPILRKPRFISILSFAFQAEKYEIEQIENDFQEIIASTNNQNFKQSGINIAGAFSPNETNYIAAKFGVSFNGTYDGLVSFSEKYAIFNGALTFGIKKHEDNEWGFGLAAIQNFRSQGFRVLPFLFWNKTINNKWGYQFILPVSYNLRYNLDSKTIFVASANYNSESYSFNQVSSQMRRIAFNHSEVLTVLKLERQIIPWVWFDFEIGYSFNFESSFEVQDTKDAILSIDPEDSLLLKLGIFISPPDSFLDDSKIKKSDIDNLIIF